MYSPLYFYFNLRSDQNLSRSIPADEMIRLLDGLKELQKKERLKFKNKDPFPWIDLSLIKANSYDSWAFDCLVNEINLISVVASKRLEEEESIEARYKCYIDLLKKIAKQISWELIDDETEDGKEDWVIWKPE